MEDRTCGLLETDVSTKARGGLSSNDRDAESVWVEIRISKVKRLLVEIIYRPVTIFRISGTVCRKNNVLL